MIKRMLPWLLFVLSLFGNLYLFVLLLNSGAWIDDMGSEVERQRERSNLALSIIRKEWVGKEAASVATLSDEIGRQGVIAKKAPDGSFEIGDLIFEIKDGVVTQVRYFD